MTAFIASVPWQVWAIAIASVGVGTAAAIIWDETRRRLAATLDLDDPTLDRDGGRW